MAGGVKIESEESAMTIASILATKGDKVVTVRAEQSIREALGVLAQHNIGALVVVDAARRPIGILSERDIVRAAARDESIFPRLVGQLMTRDLVLGRPGDDLGAVGHTMVQRRIRHLPVVVDGGTLVGIISIGDVVKAQRDQYQGEVDTLQTIVMEHGH
jgi:CBS domain-containing protein